VFVLESELLFLILMMQITFLPPFNLSHLTNAMEAALEMTQTSHLLLPTLGLNGPHSPSAADPVEVVVTVE